MRRLVATLNPLHGNRLRCPTSSVAACLTAILAVAAGRVAAQEPDTAGGPVAAAADSAAAAAPAPLELLRLGRSLVLSGSLARQASGLFQTQMVDVARLDTLGAVRESRTFGRELGAGTAYGPAVAVTGWLNETWGVRLEASLGRPALRVGYTNGGSDYLEEAASPESPRGRLSVREAGGSILFRLPVRHPFYTPYALVGLGVLQYDAGGPLSPGADSAFAGGARSLLSGTVGLGAYVPVGKRFLLQLEAVRWVAPTPVPGQVTGAVFATDSVQVAFVDPAASGLDTGVDTVAGWRITVGMALLVPLGGRAEPAEEAPQAPGASTSSNREDVRSVPSTTSRTATSMR